MFVIGREKKEELIASDARSAELIKPFIQGTHLRPWYIEDSEEYLIFSRRRTDINSYPAIREYLLTHREQLEPKPEDWAGKTWPGRKGGAYQWFEIQDTVDYWNAFVQPKIVWPDISKLPRFSMDFENRFLGNTGFIIPTDDYFLLAVLSSWATWFFISKTAQPLRLRDNRWQYRLFTQFMENIPIPEAPVTERNAIADLSRRCCDLGIQRYRLETQLQKRLTSSFGKVENGEIQGKLNQKAEEWWEQPFMELGTALKTSFKLRKNPFQNPKTADEWEPYFLGKKAERDTLTRQLDDTEAEINDRVYRLFNLTKAEIALLQKEVEH